MNIFQRFFSYTEVDATKVVIAIANGVEVVVTDIHKSLAWIASEAPVIATYIASIEGIVVSVPGAATNPEVLAAIAAANVSVQALNAFAAAETSGAADPQALVAGYVALMKARSATTDAAAAAAQPAKVTP